MKKISTIVLVLAFFWSGNAQNVKLKTLYPEPRVGQSITLTLELDFIEDYIKSSLPSELKLSGSSAFSKYQADIQANDTGYFQIGPYTFEFNGQKLQTDSIVLHVLEPLEKKEGVWIRLIEYDSIQYLIVEQYIDNEWKKDKKRKEGSSMSLTTNALDFVTLKEQPVERLRFFRRHANSTSVPIDDSDLFGPSLAYRLQIYRVTNQTGEAIALTKKFFENSPRKTIIPELLIN